MATRLSRVVGFAAMSDARNGARVTLAAMQGAEHRTALAIARVTRRMARPGKVTVERHLTPTAALEPYLADARAEWRMQARELADAAWKLSRMVARDSWYT